MFILRAIFGSLAASVGEINRRYARPTIEVTPFVRVCLVGLRIYLFVLLALMIYKFVVTVRSGGMP